MLYQNEGIYRYYGGVNWRAVLTLIIVVPINLPGLIRAINGNIDIGNLSYFCKSHVPKVRAKRQVLISLIDKASWLTSFFISFGLYILFSKVFPPTATLVDKTIESLDDEEGLNDHAMTDGAAFHHKEKDFASPDDELAFSGHHV